MRGRASPSGWAAAITLLLALISTVGRAEAGWKVVFQDDGRSRWQDLFTLVGPACNSVMREGASLRVAACPVPGTGNQTAMVWARRAVSGKVKVEFDLVQDAAVAQPLGTSSALMLFSRGDGIGGFAADPTRWAAQCCASSGASSGYRQHSRGLQANFAYRHDPRGAVDAIRLRGLKGTPGSYALLAQSAPRFPFLTGRAYRVSATRIGSKLTMDVKDSVTGFTNSFTTTNAYIGGLSSGWVGFRQMEGREGRIANFKISVAD